MPEIQIASRPRWKSWPAGQLVPGHRPGLRPDSANVERRLWAEREAQAEEDMRAWGVEVTTLSEAEMQKFRAAVRRCMSGLPNRQSSSRQIQEA